MKIVSRSGLYQRALRFLVKEHEGAAVTDELDALYGQEPNDAQIGPVIQALQRASLLGDQSEQDEW